MFGYECPKEQILRLNVAFWVLGSFQASNLYLPCDIGSFKDLQNATGFHLVMFYLIRLEEIFYPTLYDETSLSQF